MILRLMALDRWSGVASGDTSLGSVHEVAGHDSFVRGIEDDVEVNTDDSQVKGNVDDTAVSGLGKYSCSLPNFWESPPYVNVPHPM